MFTLTRQYFIDKQIIALNNGSYELTLDLKDTNSNKSNINLQSIVEGYQNTLGHRLLSITQFFRPLETFHH